MDTFPPLNHHLTHIFNVNLLVPHQIINGVNQIDLHPHYPLLDLPKLPLGLLHTHIQLSLFLCYQVAQPTFLGFQLIIFIHLFV